MKRKSFGQYIFWGLVLTLVCIFPCVSNAENGLSHQLEVAENLDEAYHAAIKQLAIRGNFANHASRLLIVSDAAGNTSAPLCAVMEREALVSFKRYTSFRDVKSSADLGFVYNGIDEAVLKRLDRLGLDRLLSISSSLENNRLILTLRAIWLEGGSFADVLMEPVFYPEVTIKVSVKESRNWVLLGRPSDVFASQSEKFSQKRLFATNGKALDIAYGDVNNDGVGDIVLLFEKHLELWIGKQNGFTFRYTFEFSDNDKRPRLPRFITGEVEVCKSSDSDSADVYLATNWMQGGMRLVWQNNKLQMLEKTYGAPLACLDKMVFGSYKVASHIFEDNIRLASEFGEQEINTGREFLSIVPVKSGKDWLLIEPDGRLYLLKEMRHISGRCGIHPAITSGASNEILACGLDEVKPSKDVVSFSSVLMPSVKEVYRSQYQQGAIWGLTALSSWKGEAFFSVRYDAGKDKSIIEKFQR